MASGRKGRERERRPVFHTWLCYVETKRYRETDGPTWTGGVPTVWTVEATFSRLSKRLPSMLLTHIASQHACRTIIRTIILVLLFEHSCHRTFLFKDAMPVFHMIRREFTCMCDSVHSGERISTIITGC